MARRTGLAQIARKERGGEMSAESEGLLTTEELARFLRFSTRHVANLVRRRIIPRIKVGRSVRFDRVAVLRALEAFEEREASRW